MTSQLQKAYLEPETGPRIDCMFNPEKFSLKAANSWSPDEVPGKGRPAMRFSGGQSGSFSLDLVFDTTTDGKSVTTHTDKLLKLMEIDPSLPGYDEARNNGRPPWVKFHWGTHIHSYKAIITSTDVTFTYFSHEGLPLRANVQLSLTQFEPEGNWGPQNPTSGTPKPNRTHQVQVGDTLDRIAARYYGDATRWRDIAALNGISDPLDLSPGAHLAIPERSG
ncbi:MAG: LysM peptidoglycan-binding domain-containing protein [Ilumatobacteraceae bacterium]